VFDVTTTAAFSLSYIATISPTSVAVPSTGIGRCRVTDCWPCTSRAGLNEPMLPIADPRPQPITTGNVGNTCWSTPLVFSVVNASSSVPAPIPTA
jgi:hypothetical protein